MKHFLSFITAVSLANAAYGSGDKAQNTPQVITLPPPKLEGPVSVEQALAKRRSVRSYKKEPLTLAEVSQILWAAYGVTKISPVSGGGLKTAPSAGATYPLEMYLVAGNVTDLALGLYRYKPEDHSLLKISGEDKRAALCKAAWGQDMIEQAPASIIYTAVYERTTARYGSRGKERYVCMDLGHSAQNVYLQAYALGIGTCAVGAFDDNAIKKVLPVSQNEVPLYIMPLGKI